MLYDVQHRSKHVIPSVDIGFSASAGRGSYGGEWPHSKGH